MSRSSVAVEVGARPPRSWHVAAIVVFAAAAVVNMQAWLVQDDLLPLGDFPGYVTVVQFVHDTLLRHGRMPAWCGRCFAGTTYFVSSFKEYLAFPLTHWLGALWATKLMFLLTKVLAALALYAILARFFRASTAGLVAGYAYGFGACASHQTEHLDVQVSSVLIPFVFLAAAETLRRRRWTWAVGLGALVALQLRNNAVQLLVCPVIFALLLLFRPWREEPAPDLDRRSWLGWGSVAAVALVAFLAFAASPLAWLAFDLQNHLLIDPEVVALQRQVFIEHSPFYLLNRANWLGSWLAEHHPPGMELALTDPQRHYLGLVPLGIALAGWVPARRRPALRRWYQVLALLCLFQYWMSLGERTLLWQIARTFHWPERLDAPLAWGLTVAAAGALGCGLLLILRLLRAPQREGPAIARIETLLGLALLLFFASHSLFEMLRPVVPLLDMVRAPGHFFDLVPFSVALLFGLGLVACGDAIRRPGVRYAMLAVVAVAVVADFWPSRAAYEVGTPLAPLRRMQEATAALPGEDGTLRLMLVPGQSGLNSMLAMHAQAGIAWNWLPWQAGRHWPVFVRAATLAGAEEREAGRPPLSDGLLAIGRIRYALVAPATPAAAEPPWQPLARSGRFSLWQQPEVMPMAYGYRAHMLYVGEPDDAVVAVIPHVFPRNLLVVSGGARLAESNAEAIAEAALILGQDDSTLSDGRSRELAASRPTYVLDASTTPPEEWASFWAARTWPEEPLVEVAYRRPAPEHIVLETDAGDRPATILVAEGHHPWWRATVDGRPADLLRAQKAFMAVRVGPGEHRIDLRFRPPFVVAAADWTSAGAFALLGLGVIVSRRRARR